MAFYVNNTLLKDRNVQRIAIALDRLVQKYPGISIMQIMWNAGDFTGRSAGMLRHRNNLDVADILERYLNTHD